MPLSNLGAKLRVVERAEVEALCQRLRMTLYLDVTHVPVEATTLADRSSSCRTGRIVQIGTPLELSDQPTHLN